MKNIIRHNLKQKVWLTGIITLIFVLCRPMMQLMSYENNARYALTQESLIKDMESFFLPGIFTDYVATLAVSVVLAIAFFSYLFSKKQVDLYHSIPVDRKNLFLANYISGIAVFLFAEAVEFIISIFIAIPNHYMTGTSVKNIFICIICNTVHFLFGYGITILAVMLTGNIIVALAASAVFAFVYPIAASLFEYFERYYYVTFTFCSSIQPELTSKYYWLSPITSYATIIQRCAYDWDDYYYDNVFLAIPAMIIPFIMTVAITVFAYYLYMKRPSEAAGRTIAFKKIRAFIEVPIVILGGMIGAWFMITSINSYKTAWIWFGAVLAALLTHFILEAVINESFSSIISHKVQFICSLAVVVLILSVFHFDLTGYDKYVPKREDIKTASVYFEEIDNNLSYMNVVPSPDEPGCYASQYESGEERSFAQQFTDGMLIDQITAISQIGSGCVNDMILRKYENSDASYYGERDAMAYEIVNSYGRKDKEGKEAEDIVSDNESYRQALLWMEENDIHEIDNNTEERNAQIEVYYVLNSGKKVMRRYEIPLSKVIDEMGKIYKNEEYIKNHFDIYEAYDNGIINKVDVFDSYESRIMSVSGEHMDKLMQAYLQDLNTITLDTISQIPIGRIAPSFKATEYYDETYSGYYIYPEFVRTLALIKSFGVNTDALKSDISADEISTISISSYNMYGDSNGNTRYADEIIYDIENDTEFIRELAPKLMNATNIYSNEMLINSRTNNNNNAVEIMAYITPGNGIQRSFSVMLKDGQIPARFKKDIAIKIWEDNQF